MILLCAAWNRWPGPRGLPTHVSEALLRNDDIAPSRIIRFRRRLRVELKCRQQGKALPNHSPVIPNRSRTGLSCPRPRDTGRKTWACRTAARCGLCAFPGFFATRYPFRGNGPPFIGYRTGSIAIRGMVNNPKPRPSAMAERNWAQEAPLIAIRPRRSGHNPRFCDEWTTCPRAEPDHRARLHRVGALHTTSKGD